MAAVIAFVYIAIWYSFSRQQCRTIFRNGTAI